MGGWCLFPLLLLLRSVARRASHRDTQTTTCLPVSTQQLYSSEQTLVLYSPGDQGEQVLSFLLRCAPKEKCLQDPLRHPWAGCDSVGVQFHRYGGWGRRSSRLRSVWTGWWEHSPTTQNSKYSKYKVLIELNLIINKTQLIWGQFKDEMQACWCS